jgi:hypothetical protein
MLKKKKKVLCGFPLYKIVPQSMSITYLHPSTQFYHYAISYEPKELLGCWVPLWYMDLDRPYTRDALTIFCSCV